MPSFTRILLCYDGSREGQSALRQGASIAQSFQAETHLLAILNNANWLQGSDVTVTVPFDVDEHSAKAILQDGIEKLTACGLITIGHLAIGDPMDQIPLFSRTLKTDLIVVGHRHRGLLARWWSRQDDGRLLDRVSCSVLVAIDAGNTDLQGSCCGHPE